MVFHMTRPYSIWPYTMAIVGIVPEHAYDEAYGQHPIGSGRYILKQWDKGQQVILTANPDYYGEAPMMKQVKMRIRDRHRPGAVSGGLIPAAVAHLGAHLHERIQIGDALGDQHQFLSPDGLLPLGGQGSAVVKEGARQAGVIGEDPQNGVGQKALSRTAGSHHRHQLPRMNP